MNNEQRTNKAFTLIELVVAIAILVMVISFAGVIFKVSIASYRTASANTDIMQKLRAITDQLNTDFRGLGKDGYLIIRSELQTGRTEFAGSAPSDFRTDRIFYFTTGDFQSWFAPDRSNISKVYFGHDSRSLYDSALPVSDWSLTRDVKLLTPGLLPLLFDSNGISYAEFRTNVPATVVDVNNLLISGVPIDIQNNPDDVRGLMCRNVGEIKIEWTIGERAANDMILWYGLSQPAGFAVEEPGPPYIAAWTPLIPRRDWPKALKFTFKLYDSKGILEQGRKFTHIVYLGD